MNNLVPPETAPIESTPSRLSRCRAAFERFPKGTFIGGTLFTLAVCLLGYYILFPSRGYFHSDCTDTLMWAQAAYDGGTLINPDFYYACFLPIGGQLLMLPLIPVFGVSMTTQIIAMLIFMLLFAAALVFLFRQMSFSLGTSLSCAAAVLLLLSGSDKLREIFWGHIIYYSLGLLFLIVGLGLVFRWWRQFEARSVRSRSTLLLTAVLLLWCLLGAMNQFEIITLFSAPLIGALIAERFVDFRHTLSHRSAVGTILLIGGIIAATVLGCGITALLLGDMKAGYAGAYSTFSDPSAWFDNFSKFLEHFTTLFGVTAEQGQPIAAVGGLLEIVKLIAAMVLLIAPIVATVLYNKLDDRPMRLLIWAHWIVTALVMMGYTFGILSTASWRLSPILCTSAVVTAALCAWCKEHRRSYRRLILLAVVPLSIVGINTAWTIAQKPADYRSQPDLYAVVDLLKDNDLDYGYATFWHANALTVMSDSDILCRGVEFEEDYSAVQPYRYQTNRRWYDDQPHQDTYFLLVDATEYYALYDANSPLLSQADDIRILNDCYCVLLFDDNLF